MAGRNKVIFALVDGKKKSEWGTNYTEDYTLPICDHNGLLSWYEEERIADELRISIQAS